MESYKRRVKLLGRYKIGAKKRESSGFTCDPDVLKDARAKAGKVPLSSIIEWLLQKWVTGEIVMQEGAT